MENIIESNGSHEASNNSHLIKNTNIMQCLVVDVANKVLDFGDFPLPKIIPKDRPRKVIVKVALSGLCNTDLYIVEGKFGSAKTRVLGHEFVGTIIEVAEEETVFQVGDRVAIDPNAPPCGACEECRRKKPNRCENNGKDQSIGFSFNGGFAQYCRVRADMVYKLDDSLKFEQAVLTEPLSRITHALDILPSPVVRGWRVLVVGGGINGLMWCSVLHHMGLRNVFLIEKSPRFIETFKNLKLGFHAAVSCNNVLDQYLTSSEVWEYNMIVDTGGNPDAIEQALPFIRKNGILVIFGESDPTKHLTISPFEIYEKEVTVVGTALNTHSSFQKAMQMLVKMGDRYFTNELLNMKTFKLKDYEEALRDLQAEKYTKIIFDCS